MHAHVDDLVLRQDVADGETIDPGSGLDVRRSHAAHSRPRIMDGYIRQLGVRSGHLRRNCMPLSQRCNEADDKAARDPLKIFLLVLKVWITETESLCQEVSPVFYFPAGI